MRTSISPSDLTFLWSECKKCFWLKYVKGITRPGTMPLVGRAAALQEQEYRDKPSYALSPSLPTGTVTSWGGRVESKHIELNGLPTRWSIKGKYDIVVTFDDHRIALIDCKVTTSEMTDDKIDFYLPQLEAYAFALENPNTGIGKVVSETGLMMWRVTGSTGNPEVGYQFSTENKYLSAGRSPDEFQEFITKVILLLEGPLPKQSLNCPFCRYMAKRKLE